MRVAFVIHRIKFEVQLGLAYLSAALRAAGHETRLFEMPAPGARWERLRAFAPGIVGYSVTSGLDPTYRAVNRHLKERLGFFSLFGGPHATFFPELIEQDDAIDAVCVGEGEGAIVELADRLERGEDVRQVRNLWVRDGARIVRNLPRPLIEDLDSVPFPDADLFFRESAFLRDYAMKRAITARGCPFHCTYCFNEHYHKNVYAGRGTRLRRRSVANVIGELREVKARWPLELVQFVDDTFNMLPRWLEAFAPAYRREIGVPFQCNVHASLVTPRVAELLAEAGCAFLTMGIEAGDDRLRNEVLRRPMKRAQIVRAADLLHARGIRIKTENMCGLPSGGFAEDLETIRLNAEIRADAPMATLFQPYPKLPITRFAAAGGHFDGDYGRIGPDYFFHSPLTWPSPRERRRVEHLHHLFGLAVRAPWLLPVIARAADLPLGPLYRTVFKAVDGYHAWRLLPYRMGPAEWGRLVWGWMTRYH